MTGFPTPVETLNFSSETALAYLELSEKNASSAVTRLRRSDFMAVRYALPFVFANFGIAIAAKMPMMTTTINSSIRVKPLRSLRMSAFQKVESGLPAEIGGAIDAFTLGNAWARIPSAGK